MSSKCEIMDCAAFIGLPQLAFVLPLIIRKLAAASMLMKVRAEAVQGGVFLSPQTNIKVSCYSSWRFILFFLSRHFYFAVKLGHFVSLITPSEAMAAIMHQPGASAVCE